MQEKIRATGSIGRLGTRNCGSVRFSTYRKLFRPDNFVFGQNGAGNNWTKVITLKELNLLMKCWMFLEKKRKALTVYKYLKQSVVIFVKTKNSQNKIFISINWKFKISCRDFNWLTPWKVAQVLKRERFLSQKYVRSIRIV